MKKSLLAAATALMLLGAAGAASANNGNKGGHKDAQSAKGHSDARNHVYRDCDGIARDHHDNRNKKGKDCDDSHNRLRSTASRSFTICWYSGLP